MKADFFKRIFAYLIDYFIIMIVLMGITASVNVGSDLTKEINDVMNDYKEGNITVEEYTEKVIENFSCPKHVGELEDANGVGQVGSPACGDIMKIFLKINDQEIIENASFKTFGCGAAVASSSMATEMPSTPTA